MLIKIYLLSYNISDWNLRWNEAEIEILIFITPFLSKSLILHFWFEAKKLTIKDYEYKEIFRKPEYK